MIGKINSQMHSHQTSKNESKNVTKSSNDTKGVENKTPSRVERIAAQIADGTYKIDMSKTAKAVLETLT